MRCPIYRAAVVIQVEPDVIQVEPDPLSRLCHRTPPQHLSPRCSSTRQRPAD